MSKANFVKFVKAKFCTIQRFPCYVKDWGLSMF